MTKSNRFKFNKTNIENLPTAEKRRVEYYDTVVPKLAMAVTHTGVKTFYVVKWVNGKTRWIALGKYPEVTVEQARKLAEQALGDFAAGLDPVETRNATRSANREESILAFNAWNDYVSKRSPRWSDSHIKDHAKVSQAGGEPRTRGWRPGESRLTQPGILLPLLKLPLKKIDNERVEAWLRKEVLDRPTHARNAYTLLRAFINWCSENRKYTHQTHNDACRSRAIRDELPKKNAKKDALEKEQLQLWFSETKKLSNFKISAYLQILLLIGARPMEAASLEWANVDLRWNRMTIRDKEEGDRMIPITPYVSQLLKELHTLNQIPPSETRVLNGKVIKNDLASWKPSPWVFSSNTSKSGHLENPSDALMRVCAAAELPHITLHGLRRSFKSVTEWVECPAGVVAQIMGHKPSATAEQHYTVRPIDLLRKWHTKIECWILTEANLHIDSHKSET